MYKYSPITKLYIKNFRNLGEVEIDFTKSPIVTLVGENEAGKTSVIKAFGVCALHANPRDQKDYIRQGTKMFGVAIDLADGTRITRIKEANTNKYAVKHPDGTEWNMTKITDGLPKEVQDVMGLIEEPETKEFLHIRTYEDKLLFVVTPNSTNYKVMYNALKVEQLTSAIKIGSNEANNLKSLINKNEISIETLGTQLKGIRIYDTEPLTSARDHIKNNISTLSKIKKAIDIANNIENTKQKLGALQLIDKFNLGTIDEVKASKLNSINKLLNNISELSNYYNSISEIDTVEYIDCSNLDKIANIINKRDKLIELNTKASVLMQLDSMSEISEGRVIQLNKAVSLTNKLRELQKNIDSIDVSSLTEINVDIINKLQRAYSLIDANKQSENNLNAVNNEIIKINDYMKQCGIAVETCPNCGEAVIFDIDKLEKSVSA